MNYLPLYSRFITGTKLKHAINVSNKLRKKNISCIFDFSVESNIYINRNIDEIFKQIENIDNQYIALKFSALGIDNLNQSKNLIDQFYKENIIKKYPNQFLIDSEDYNIQKNINELSNYALDNYNTKHNKYFYKTLQLYRNDIWDLYLNDIDYFIRREKYALKLVRGAYIKTDYKYNVINSNKLITDNQYNRAIEYFFYYLDTYPQNKLIVASHNKESYELTKKYIEKDYHKFNNNVKFATLLGMGDSICYDDTTRYHKLKYIPYGPFLETTPYLFRRFIENKNMLSHIL